MLLSKMKLLLCLVIAGLALSGCGDKEKPNVELIDDMMDSPAYKAQDTKVGGGSSMLMPPANTLPVGMKRYPYAPGDADGAEKGLKNPIEGQFTPEVLARGANRYEIYCGVCHGALGKGDGTVAEKMPVRPPSLVQDKVKAYRDGRFFHIITHGKGVMGSYANQIKKEEDRWAVVNYIRNLQKMAN